MSKEKIRNIQGLRGVAVLLVVFSHMLPVEGKYAQFEYILPKFFEIGWSGVDLFFLISGFVMVTVTRSSIHCNLKIQKFLYRRVSRIYPLYWFYSVLILGVYLLKPSLVNSSQGNKVDILASFLLMPQNLLPLVNVGWTLIHEMYFYFIFAILLLLPKKRLSLGLILWGAIVFVGNIYLSWVGNPFINIYFSPLTIEFIAGAFIAKLYYRGSIQGNVKVYTFTALTTWIGGYYIFHAISGEFAPSGWIRIVVFGVPATLALYVALLYEKNSWTIMPKWICKIGDASYSIYLSHVIVLSIVGRSWALFAAKGYVDNIIMLLLMIIAVLFAGYISFTFIEKTLLKKMRKFEVKIFS